MASPDEDLKVKIQSLRDDGQVWFDISGTLSAVSKVATGLGLDANALSFAAAEAGAVETYERVRNLVEDVTREGSYETSSLYQTLVQVADQYTFSDQRARDRYDGIWEPK